MVWGHIIGGSSCNCSFTSNYSLQDYQIELMLLEQHNKKRLIMARQEQEAQASSRRSRSGSSSMLSSPSSHTLQDHKMQLMLLEQQKKRPTSKAEAEEVQTSFQRDPDVAPSSTSPSRCNHAGALQDLQMQLILLERQNRRRLILARGEIIDSPLT